MHSQKSLILWRCVYLGAQSTGSNNIVQVVEAVHVHCLRISVVVIGKVRAGSPDKMLLRGEYSGRKWLPLSPQIVKVAFHLHKHGCVYPS